jgi:cytochrome c oxidase subunit I+III
MQGVHAVTVLALAAWLLARIGAGLLTPRQRASFDNAALLRHGSMAQRVVVGCAPQLVAWRAQR